jgi:hypothetical protein
VRIVSGSITHEELRRLAEGLFGNLVKAVVDVGREVVALDAELHSDLEALLIEDGSRQKDLWGINLYPDEPEESFVEFDSLINVRPSQNNRTRGVENEDIRRKITEIIMMRIQK